MAVAIRSIYSAGVALVGASVVAVSPLTPSAPDVPLRSVTAPAIELTVTAPAFGAVPFQIGVNALGNILAATPILLGSTEQCTVCLGPNTPSPDPRYSPFTGWGLIGVGAGLISSPIALVRALQTTGDLGQALAIALLAIQIPIQNTSSLFTTSREPNGGFAFYSAFGRASDAITEAILGAARITGALVGGPIEVLEGAIAGTTAFLGTWAQTGDLPTAVAAGRAKFQPAVENAVGRVLNTVRDTRFNIYTTLNYGPGPATSPIPTIPAPTLAATSGPTSKVVNSFKAVPNAASSTAADNDGSAGKSDDKAGGDQGAAASTSKKKSGLGGSKRQAATR